MHQRKSGYGPFGDFDKFFEKGFGPERMFRRHGGLKYYVLWLLSSEPMKGSEIMDKIQGQTMGWWRPSPGSIYPLLSTLENEGFIQKGEDGKFFLTDEGREEIGMGPEGKRYHGEGEWDVERVLTDLESYTTYLSEITFDVKSYEERIRKISERLNGILKGSN